MSTYEFTSAEKVVEVKTERTVAIGNMPPVGTRMRATLGNTVIEGTVSTQNFYQGGPRHHVVWLTIDQTAVEIHMWIKDGWTFELIEEGEVAA